MNDLAVAGHNQTAIVDPEIAEALVQGDLSGLKPAERTRYYMMICERVGVDAAVKPFDYLRLNNKLVLYANKACAEQLRKRKNISITVTNRETINDVYVVTVVATLPDGRKDESTGAVTIGKLAGDNLANALMKAETKAKRRVTLSVCGLGMLDETEIDTIRGARVVKFDDDGQPQLSAPMNVVIPEGQVPPGPTPEQEAKLKERREKLNARIHILQKERGVSDQLYHEMLLEMFPDVFSDPSVDVSSTALDYQQCLAFGRELDARTKGEMQP